MKHHDDYALIYSNDNPETPAHGWIQWKGSDVCVDLTCICGETGHIDGYFMYSLRCSSCGRMYAVGQNIKLIPLDTPELQAANKYHTDYMAFGDSETDSTQPQQTKSPASEQRLEKGQDNDKA